MTEDEITSRIATLHPNAVMEVAGADCNFELYIINEDFNGMNTMQRQKSILTLFKDELATGKLHALSIKAKTPQELEMSTGFVQIQL
jgi:BolA protein